MVTSADDLLQLMKQRIDAFQIGDNTLRKILTWSQQKCNFVPAPYYPNRIPDKPTAVRAFYFELFFALTLEDLHLATDITSEHGKSDALASTLEISPGRLLDRNLNLDRALVHTYTYALFVLNNPPSLKYGFNYHIKECLDRAVELASLIGNSTFATLNPSFNDDNWKLLLKLLAEFGELERKLRELQKRMPDTSQENQKNAEQWWLANGKAWANQLRAVMIEYRDIGHDWQFSNAQKKRLQQYYDANKLLVDCLNSDCYVSREVRQEIEETLLLAIAQIKKYQ